MQQKNQIMCIKRYITKCTFIIVYNLQWSYFYSWSIYTRGYCTNCHCCSFLEIENPLQIQLYIAYFMVNNVNKWTFLSLLWGQTFCGLIQCSVIVMPPVSCDLRVRIKYAQSVTLLLPRWHQWQGPCSAVRESRCQCTGWAHLWS